VLENQQHQNLLFTNKFKTMRKILFGISTLLISSLVYSQGDSKIQFIEFSAGKTHSTLLFKDDAGVKNENISFKSGNIANISLGIELADKHILRPELNYMEVGALGDFASIPVTWKLNYLGLGAGYLYEIIGKENFSLRAGALIRFDYLMKAQQTIGIQRYNLNEAEALKRGSIFSSLLVNPSFSISENAAIFGEYRFGMGIMQIEKEELLESQKTRSLSQSLSVGLRINL
jgi:hypothetical protein